MMEFLEAAGAWVAGAFGLSLAESAVGAAFAGAATAWLGRACAQSGGAPNAGDAARLALAFAAALALGEGSAFSDGWIGRLTVWGAALAGAVLTVISGAAASAWRFWRSERRGDGMR